MKRWMLAGIAMLTFGSGCGAAGGERESGDDLSTLSEEHARGLAQSLASADSASARYTFPVPDGWITETDPLPPPWDPSFPFAGSEDLRFPIGWPDPTTTEWWSYDYLLWVDSGPAITSAVLERAIVGYYKGLMDSCISVPCDPSKFAARLKRVVATPPLTVFAGQTDIFDVLGTPITLNLVVSSVVCPRSKHRALLFSASPFPASAPIWKELLGLQLQFRCN
jgi:hypothetical protein